MSRTATEEAGLPFHTVRRNSTRVRIRTSIDSADNEPPFVVEVVHDALETLMLLAQEIGDRDLHENSGEWRIVRGRTEEGRRNHTGSLSNF